MINKIKNIVVYSSGEEQEKIYVRVKKKKKLTDLYPQRAILEESRKNSSLIQANDWIDHGYYDKVVEESGKTNQKIFEKYGAKLPKDQPMTFSSNASRPVKDITEY